MRLEGSGSIAAQRDRVWEFLIDARQAASCVPGIDGVDVVDDTHFAIATGDLGALKTKVTVNVELSDLREPEHLAFLANGQHEVCRSRPRRKSTCARVTRLALRSSAGPWTSRSRDRWRPSVPG